MGANLIVALAVFALGALGGWWITDTKADAEITAILLEHSQEKERQIEQAILADEQAQREVAQKNAAMHALDLKKTQELEDARKETRRLRSCIDAGTCGVRIITKVVTTPTPTQSEGDGAAARVGNDSAALDGDIQQRILDLREAIAEDAAKLGYLQGYAERCSGKTIVLNQSTS